MRLRSGQILPDFIIGGAPRSGTTFLAQALALHPRVFLAQPFIPEPKVFMGPEQPMEAYFERYFQLFEPADRGQLLGEKTSYYLESASICRLMRHVVPYVRLIFLVREPVARAYSNYLWSKKNGLETLSFEEALLMEGCRPNPLPAKQAYARPFDYLQRSDYAALARPYLETFGAEQIRFFLFEDLLQQPKKLLGEVSEFLQLPAHSFDLEKLTVVNGTKGIGPELDARTESRLRDVMRPIVMEFARLTGLSVSAWEYEIDSSARQKLENHAHTAPAA